MLEDLHLFVKMTKGWNQGGGTHKLLMAAGWSLAYLAQLLVVVTVVEDMDLPVGFITVSLPR